MKVLIGVLMVIGGLLFGIWAGIWWALIGGIADVIIAAKADEVITMDIGIGVLKVLFSAVIGKLTAIALVVPGVAILARS